MRWRSVSREVSALDLQLTPDPHDSHAFYDRLGNRWVFHCHAEYLAARRAQLIDWLATDALLCFL